MSSQASSEASSAISSQASSAASSISGSCTALDDCALIYCGNNGACTGGFTQLTAALLAAGADVVDQHDSLADLDRYNVVFVAVPRNAMSGADFAALVAYYNAGGHIVGISEHTDFQENAISNLNTLTATLGFGSMYAPGVENCGCGTTTVPESTSVTQHMSALQLACTSDVNGGTLLATKSPADILRINSRYIAASDLNVFDDECGGFTACDNLQLFSNLWNSWVMGGANVDLASCESSSSIASSEQSSVTSSVASSEASSEVSSVASSVVSSQASSVASSVVSSQASSEASSADSSTASSAASSEESSSSSSSLIPSSTSSAESSAASVTHVCGNGIPEPPYEECDAGSLNGAPNSPCLSGCMTPPGGGPGGSSGGGSSRRIFLLSRSSVSSRSSTSVSTASVPSSSVSSSEPVGSCCDGQTGTWFTFPVAYSQCDSGGRILYYEQNGWLNQNLRCPALAYCCDTFRGCYYPIDRKIGMACGAYTMYIPRPVTYQPIIGSNEVYACPQNPTCPVACGEPNLPRPYCPF